MIKLHLPITDEQIKNLQAGDTVSLSGNIYTARDAAHKRLVQMIETGEPLPFDLQDAVLYYAGPCPSKPGQVLNSCGPTTSGRMDSYAPVLYERGVRAAIGKGPVAQKVKDALVKYHGVYFVATGGAGALISKCVTEAKIIAFEDLGAEAIRMLTVKELPLIVGVDASGRDIYEIAPAKYAKRNLD